MTFQIATVTQVKLCNINIRREIHGDEHVPAIDLAMRLEGGNDLLDMLDPALRTVFYFNKAATEGQSSLPEVLAVLPNLRFAKLNGMKFSWAKGERHKGYFMLLDYGLGDNESNVNLDDCTVTNWRFETKEGGTVILEWVVQYAGEKLTSDVRGKLTGLTDEHIHIQLMPPATPHVVTGKSKPGNSSDDKSGELDLEDNDEITPEQAFADAVDGDE